MSKFAIEHKSDFLWWSIFFSPELNGRRSIIAQQIKPKLHILQIFFRKFNFPWMKYHKTFGINAICIFMYRLQERHFSLSEICRQNRHFENGYHNITASLENSTVTENTLVQLARKKHNHWSTSNNPGIMKLTSFQNISPRSRFSAANSLPCQNGRRPFTY